MTRAFKPLIPATPTFNDTGIARSDRYEDVYHSASGALEQANYVFLQGNGLPERWQGRDQFTVLETGFGLGNNFLATWAAWRDDAKRSERLHFVSFEAHPFSQADLAVMLQNTPLVLRELADALIAQWPLLLPGIHRLEFAAGAVTLTLFFGDIQQASYRMQCQADAFYLDGFAPRVNPAMWSKELFGQLVRMAAPGATAATWCSASQVRQDLQDAGFMVERHPGFAFKRHMIRARLRPHLGRKYASRPTQPVLIVGGGIAGAATAYALALRGIASTVIDPVFAQDLGGAHLGHAAVAMTPIITSDDAPRARLSRAGIQLALQRWQPFIGRSLFRCGSFVAHLSAEEAENAQKSVQKLDFDTDWVQYIDAQAASQLAQADFAHGVLHFPRGVCVYPQQLLRQLLRHPLITPLAQSVVTLSAQDSGWQVITEQNQQLHAEHLVVANAAQAPALLSAVLASSALPGLNMDVLGGQSNVISASALSQQPQAIIAGHGYVIPFMPSQSVVGSTYSSAERGVSSAAHEEIMRKVSQLVSLQQTHPMALTSWFGLRAAFKDHLPRVCQALPGLWLNIGHGSYGFSWAALAADIITTQLSAEPSVIERDLSRALSLRLT